MDVIELDPVVDFKPAPVLDQPKIEKNDQSVTINTETKKNTNEMNNEEIEEMKDSFNASTNSLLFCKFFFLI
jgi:hypothetical protein